MSKCSIFRVEGLTKHAERKLKIAPWCAVHVRSYYHTIASLLCSLGVSPLYQLCLEFVAGLYEDYVPMLHCLPALVQRAVRDNHRKRCNLRNFTVAQL